MPKPFSLSKHERLKSKKDIDTLFLHGEAYFVFPFKVYFSFENNSNQSGVQIGVSAPKKILKRAVDRNYAKRIAREAYRVQKVSLVQVCQDLNLVLKFMIVYTNREDINFPKIQNSVAKIIDKLSKKAQNMALPS